MHVSIHAHRTRHSSNTKGISVVLITSSTVASLFTLSRLLEHAWVDMRVTLFRRDTCTARRIVVRKLRTFGAYLMCSYQRTVALCCDADGHAGLVVSLQDMYVGLLFPRQIETRI
jgi:hypothetical protein